MTAELCLRLEKALQRTGKPSSDYDLNPDAVLPEGRSLRAASVLVPVTCSANPHVILTKRSSALKHHPGQVAFPGGKVEDSDEDETAAALREAQEEIGLSPEGVTVLGSLPSHETVTGFRVTPVVAIVSDGFVPFPDTGEVAEVFRVPLEHLLNQQNYSVQSRRWRGQRRFFFTAPYGPYYIWGATARILRALADRMADDKD
ncbi:MAG: CoA pyrophosphatase [Paracoccaceae bacterium]